MMLNMSEVRKGFFQEMITSRSLIRNLVERMMAMPAQAMCHPQNEKNRDAILRIAGLPLAQTGSVTYQQAVEMLICNTCDDPGAAEDALFELGKMVVGFAPHKREVK